MMRFNDEWLFNLAIGSGAVACVTSLAAWLFGGPTLFLGTGAAFLLPILVALFVWMRATSRG
jgi:hypothetical protein